MANMLCHDVLVRLSDGELTQMSNTQQCHMTFWHISKDKCISSSRRRG